MEKPSISWIANLAVLGSVVSCQSLTTIDELGIEETASTLQIDKASPDHNSQIKNLSYRQLYRLFADRIHSGTTPEGRQWTATFKPPDLAAINWVGPDGSGSDQGSWHIEGNSVCFQWVILNSGKEQCMTVYIVDTGQYNVMYDNGRLYSHMVVSN